MSIDSIPGTFIFQISKPAVSFKTLLLLIEPTPT